MKKILHALIPLILLVPAFALAENFHGKIVKIKGDVFIKDIKGAERKPEESAYIVITDEKINTRENGKAVVKFTNGSITVIGENSSLGIEKPTMFAHIRGKILFAFAKISGPSRRVRTNSAVFGVRATSFIVKKDQTSEMLALKEGLVNVESTKGDFEIHQTKERDDFHSFRSEMETGVKDMQKEGDAYIKKMNDEYISYKKSFLLKADTFIQINGNRIDKGPIADSLKAEFTEFEDFAGEFLDGFREDKTTAYK